MAYKQLDFKKRCEIYGLWRAGHKRKDIAKEVGVHASTISRELKRNIIFVRTKLGYWAYKPNYAQVSTEERHKKKPKKVKLTPEVKKFIQEKILEEWSPDQISGYAKKQGLFLLSHERIYQFILKDKKAGGSLYKHLRHQHKKYRKHYGSPARHYGIKDRKFIEERPQVVEDKTRIGDWEVDTIIGQERTQAIVSMVERVSKKTVLKKVERKTAEFVSSAMIEGLKPLSRLILTLTGDNGGEFAYHARISKALEAEFYFAHPYASWERGLNENTNGLVRQYLPKGSRFTHVTDEKLRVISDKLNNRPRKTLGYATPDEVFFKTSAVEPPPILL